MQKQVGTEKSSWYLSRLKTKGLFNFKDLYKYFPTHRYKYPPNADIKRDYGVNRRKALNAKVFEVGLRKIIDDIVENNITLRLPTYTNYTAQIGMQPITGERLKHRQMFDWYDLVAANFTLYRLFLTNHTERETKSYEIFVGDDTNARIDKYAMDGKIYY